ncbi:MAG: hypothetical protein M1834_004285 [Cirrosporium novae-zelandiae]|nr:MAG: hypothetical protein M1834_004285 [Cirrosporium novae-zelandiae]
MSPILLLLFAGTFLFSTTTFLVLSKRQRDVLFRRFHIRGRRASTSKTPPRSLSPSKKNSNTATGIDYTNAFPPSRREALANIISKLPRAERIKFLGHEVDSQTFARSQIPFDADWRQCDGNLFTPCGFSVAEIRALGDFPDYAELSGIPLPQPYKEFNIDKAIPRPYRPFRWVYHQTMSITKMEIDWWIELENTYRKRIEQRRELFRKHGNMVLDYLPGSELACKELMEMVLQFVCARYPQYFSLSSDNTIFHNKILNTETKIKSKHPLHVLLENIPEDFAITLRNPETGYYHFRAGLLCSALGWNVQTKLGMDLPSIHTPIPDYKEKMQFSMDRYFTKKPTDRAIQRGSWGLEVDQPLFMPPGDPKETYRLSQDPNLTLDRLHLRVDWQTLRRLPLSAAIVFNFKALFTPISEFRDEPYVPALVNKVLKEGKKNLMEYKGTWHVEHVAIPALNEWEREQVEKGMVEDGWEVRTLEESPWFPGWQEKWHRQQGY